MRRIVPLLAMLSIAFAPLPARKGPVPPTECLPGFASEWVEEFASS